MQHTGEVDKELIDIANKPRDHRYYKRHQKNQQYQEDDVVAQQGDQGSDESDQDEQCHHPLQRTGKDSDEVIVGGDQEAVEIHGSLTSKRCWSSRTIAFSGSIS